MATMQYSEERALLINDHCPTPIKPGFRSHLEMKVSEHRPNNIPTGHVKIDVEIKDVHTGNNWEKRQAFQFLLTENQARELADFLLDRDI